MEKYIFLFTLSPVQSFIAQARKTQDLYAGSLILSKLTKTAAISAKEQGITLVFPTEMDENTEGGASFPNRFIGTIEDDSKDLQAIGQAIEDTVIEEFKKHAEKALEDVKYEKDVPKGFWEQINNHLDINWLFHEIKDNNYEAAYKEIEPLMTSLKNVRLITNTHPEAGRKCSIDGERNALFRGQNTTNKQLKDQAVPISTGAWLNPNEGLSAVSLIKRTYEKQDFPSTVEIALKYQINKLKKEESELLNCFKQLFSKSYPIACSNLLAKEYLTKIEFNNQLEDWRINFDDEFIFEDNLTEKNIPNLTQLKIAKEVQQQFKPFLTDKYYAIIAFDGDKMGELLSGERCQNKPSNLEAFQGTVSQLLRGFAASITDEKAENYVWKDTVNVKPHVIYAGGDDFLGFVNLHDLFEVVEKLRTKFETEVNNKLQAEYPLKNDFTFSMGIAIAHYKTPLSMVLKTAREMEELAKNEGKRNAFAIAALKHSGENHKTYFKWDLKNSFSKWKILENLVNNFQNDCSETFVRSLDREFYLLQDKDKNVELDILKDKDKKPLVIKPEEEAEKVKEYFGLFPEIKRLVKRSLKTNSTTNEAIIAEDIWKLISYERLTKSYLFSVQNALELVKIALFLKRETKKEKNGN